MQKTASNCADLAGVSTEVSRILQRPKLPRKNADHASRTERPASLADIVVLEKAAINFNRLDSGQGSDGTIPTTRCATHACMHLSPYCNLSCRSGSGNDGRLARPISWTNAALTETESQIHQWTITPSGTEGYAKAEVTVGGVDSDELSAEIHGEQKKSRALFRRRSSRRNRTSWRIQLPVGMGIRRGRWSSL